MTENKFVGKVVQTTPDEIDGLFKDNHGKKEMEIVMEIYKFFMPEFFTKRYKDYTMERAPGMARDLNDYILGKLVEYTRFMFPSDVPGWGWVRIGFNVNDELSSFTIDTSVPIERINHE